MTLLQSMINKKGCHAFLCVMEKEGKRANYWRDRKRECVREREYLRERKMDWVQRSRHSHKHITET